MPAREMVSVSTPASSMTFAHSWSSCAVLPFLRGLAQSSITLCTRGSSFFFQGLSLRGPVGQPGDGAD